MDGWGHKQMYFPLPTPSANWVWNWNTLGLAHQGGWLGLRNLEEEQLAPWGVTQVRDVASQCKWEAVSERWKIWLGPLVGLQLPLLCIISQCLQPLKKSWPCLRPQLPEQNLKLIVDRVLHARLGSFALMSYPPLYRQTQWDICLEI